MSTIQSIDGFAVARRQELQLALERATDVPSLKTLLAGIATVQELARRIGVALEEQNHIAKYRVLASYKLGRLLRETVRRGGRGSKSPRMTSIRGGSSAPLPPGISRNLSMKLQRLAAIPEQEVQGYLEATRRKGRSISVADLLRTCHAHQAVSRCEPRKEKQSTFWNTLWEAVQRVMKVDIAVGVDAENLGCRVMRPECGLQVPLHGTVFVKADDEPGPWLKKLATERLRGTVSDAMVLTPAAVDAPWFRLVQDERWSCCFFQKHTGTNRSMLVAYHGARRHGFFLVLKDLGTVLEPPSF